MKKILLLLLLAPLAHAATPVCLYQDLTSTQVGSYVNIFGLNFGASQGSSTLTINGTAVTNVLYWGADVTGERQQIGFQVPSGTTGSGFIVLTVGGNSCGATSTANSNALPFTVQTTGNIWYIGAQNDQTCPMYPVVTGSNGNCGTTAFNCSTITAYGGDHATANSLSNPWGLDYTDGPSVLDSGGSSPTSSGYAQYRTPITYSICLHAGDTLVFLNGVNFPWFGGNGWHSPIYVGATTTSSTPITVISYPGASATLGGNSAVIRGTAFVSTYVNMAGMTVIGNGGGEATSGLARAVNNNLQCPTCSASSATIDGGSFSETLGNWVHNSATSLANTGISKTFHSIYFGGINMDFGWNRIENYQVGNGTTTGASYNGIQIHNDYSLGFYNVSIHDNDISDLFGSCINISAVDPSLGYVDVYNNVCHHAGVNLGTDSSNSPHSCFAHKGYAAVAGPVTNVAITSSVATITSENGFTELTAKGNSPSIGFGGFSTATELNGNWYSVLPTSIVQTSFTINCSNTSCPDLASTADTGYYVSAGGAVVTAYSVASNTAILTATGATGSIPFKAGEWVTFTGLHGATFLNGYTLQVLSAGLTSTQFEVTCPSTCTTTSTTADTGVVQGGGVENWYNNTGYDCSGILAYYPGETSSCGLLALPGDPGDQIVWTNNVILQPNYGTGTTNQNVYICGGGGNTLPNTGAGYTQISGTNDYWYGATTGSISPPVSNANMTTQTTTVNPDYVNPTNCVGETICAQNFGPAAGSPLLGAGVAVGPVYLAGASVATLTWDFNAATRPSPPAIGAMEYVAPTSSTSTILGAGIVLQGGVVVQ